MKDGTIVLNETEVDRWKEALRREANKPASEAVLGQLATASDDRMLHLKEAATYAGMTASGLRKLVHKKEIRYFQRKSHGPILFKTEWLEEHIDRHTHAAKHEQPPPVSPRRKKRQPKRQVEPTDDRHGFRWDLFRK